MYEVDITSLSATEIAQMFSDYVERMQDQERHTEAACKEVEAFDLCCASEFPRNIRLQSIMYDKMMNCAVEFEESGFIAGFQTAVALFSGKEEVLQEPTQIPTPEPPKRLPEAITKPKGKEFRENPPEDANFAKDGYVKSTQIAEMFGQTNYKVVKRIEDLILPYCSEDLKKHFIKVDGYNIQHKRCVFYKLDDIACRLYIKEIEPKKSTFVNIAGGIAKLEELLQRMYPTEKIALPA